MTDCKSHHRRLLPTGVDRDVAAFPGIEPHATPPGTPWNWTALRLDRCCPLPPGITPGLEDCPSPLSSLESPGLGRLSARIDAALLAWYNTRPRGFHLPRCCVRRIYSYHLVLSVSRQEQFCTTWYCACFQRTVFIPPGIVHTFQRTVFIPPGIVRVFREQFLYHLVL